MGDSFSGNDTGRILWGFNLQYSIKRPSLLSACRLDSPTPLFSSAVEWTCDGEPVGACLYASPRFASVIAARLAFFASIRIAVEGRAFSPRARGNVPKKLVLFCFCYLSVISGDSLVTQRNLFFFFAYGGGCMSFVEVGRGSGFVSLHIFFYTYYFPQLCFSLLIAYAHSASPCWGARV